MQKPLLSCLALLGLGLLSACGASPATDSTPTSLAVEPSVSVPGSNSSLDTGSPTATGATTGSSKSTETTVKPSASPTTSTAPNKSTTSVTCGADNAVFPNLTQVAGAGSGYELPKVAVTCGSDTLKMTSNGMISYAFVSKTPNGLKSQNFSWTITTKPKIAAQQTSIKTTMGTIAFTVTGIPVYGPMEGPVPTQEAFGDPVFNNILDTCGGHTGYNADYHYHTIYSVSDCALQETIVGYALDGFPIYSNPSYKWKSGYEKTGNPKTNSWDAYTYKGGSSSLDECNGQKQADGSYRYYVTQSFPYVIGCYTGTAQAQSGAAAQPMPPMGPPGPVGKSSAIRDHSNGVAQSVTPTTILCIIKEDI